MRLGSRLPRGAGARRAAPSLILRHSELARDLDPAAEAWRRQRSERHGQSRSSVRGPAGPEAASGGEPGDAMGGPGGRRRAVGGAELGGARSPPPAVLLLFQLKRVVRLAT